MLQVGVDAGEVLLGGRLDHSRPAPPALLPSLSAALLPRLRPHLAARVDALQRLPRGGVPEADAAVGGAAAADQQAVLVRRPGDGLDRGLVLAEAQHRLRRLLVPHQQLVVVAAAGQLAVVGGPAQAADLSGAGGEAGTGLGS